MVEVPGRSFVGRAFRIAEAIFAVWVGVLGVGSWSVAVALAFGGEVLFMADHGGVAIWAGEVYDENPEGEWCGVVGCLPCMSWCLYVVAHIRRCACESGDEID